MDHLELYNDNLNLMTIAQRVEYENIFELVIKITGIDKVVILSPTRQRNVKDARHFLCYNLKARIPGLTLKMIGRTTSYSGHDHSTVINSIRRWQEYTEVEKEKRSIQQSFDIAIKYNHRNSRHQAIYKINGCAVSNREELKIHLYRHYQIDLEII